MHPELEKATKTAKLSNSLNGHNRADVEAKHASENARLRIKVDELSEEVNLLKKQLLEATKTQPMTTLPSLGRVLQVTASAFGMTPRAVFTNRRIQAEVIVRQVVMYLAWEMSYSDNDTATFFGFDRTSVIHGRKKVEKRLPVDLGLAEKIEAIKLGLV